MMESSADISACGLYRYSLTRTWGPGTKCVWIMLNPSTADAREDDATIRKCIGFAKRWGHESIEVVNLFAFRATSPLVLPEADDPIGDRNDLVIERATRGWGMIVCGWGNHGSLHDRSKHVMKTLAGRNPQCLTITKKKEPGHPLYLSYDLTPAPYVTWTKL